MTARLRRPWLLSGIVAAAFSLGPLLLTDSRGASAAPSYGPLVTAAMKYEGQYGGECYMFMQNVVKEVTGRLISGDYRHSYLNAGAVEVPLSQAQSGDIIQLADDRNTAADANYPGLHTLFIMDVEGEGKFKVIDSNYLFDGMVRVHAGYVPLASAARYPNISVHVWRVPLDRPATAQSTTNAPGAPDRPAVPRDVPLLPGSAAVVDADGDCLRIRSQAGVRGKELACPPTGAVVTVLDGAAESDGYRWERVQSGSVAGWAADIYLRVQDRPATPRPVPLQAGITAAVDADGDCLHIRDHAGFSGKDVACPPTGAVVKVLDGAAESDGYRWQRVQSGPVSGWAADIYLQPKPDTVTVSSVTAEPAPTPPAPPKPSIVGGEVPPKGGGYALFVFNGGVYSDLLKAAGCTAETAAFWATSAEGELARYLPAATVAVVNAGWDKLFQGRVPPDTALLGRCS